MRSAWLQVAVITQGRKRPMFSPSLASDGPLAQPRPSHGLVMSYILRVHHTKTVLVF